MRTPAGLRFAPSSALLRSTGKKICALLAALRSGSVFALELGRRAAILLARTVPGPRFALPERPFCGLPRRACACDAHFVKLCQNPIKTESKRMSACFWETPQPTKKRRQRASRRMLRDSCVRFPCQRVSAAFRCVPGGSPDAVGAARGGPGAPTEPPGRVMACLRSVPRASRNGLRRLLLARLGAQRRFGAPGPRFWLVWEGPRGLLGRLSRSIFARPGIPRYALPSRVRQRSTNKT